MDFAGGIGVQDVGHRHPAVVESVIEQLTELIHTGPVTLHAPSGTLAKEIATRAPSPDDNQATLFPQQRAEAVESAIKIARHA